MFNIPTQRLAKVTVTETTSAVTLSVNPIVEAALSFTPRHLVLRAEMQATSGNPNVYFRLNGDSGSNYNGQMLTGYGTTKAAGRDTSGTEFRLAGNIDDLSNAFTPSETLFPDALSTRTHKSALCQTGRLEEVVRVAAGRWASTAAITSVTIYVDSSTFAAGSTFELCVVDETFNIDEQILGSNGTTSVTSIAAADGDLVCIGNFRSTRSGLSDNMDFWLNGDTTPTNYSNQWIRGIGTAVAAAAINDNDTGVTVATTATTSAFSPYLAQVTNFSDGSNDRVITTLSGAIYDASNAQVKQGSIRWNNTSAVTGVEPRGTVSDPWLAGSMLSTYAVPKGLITRTELSGDASSVAFTSIPQTYDHLELTAYIRDNRSATSDDILMSLTPVGGSSDTTNANYDTQLLQASSTTVTAAQSAADRAIGNIPAASETANVFGALTITFYNYTKTDRHKHSLSVSGRAASASGMYIRSNRWENTAAIEAITLTPSAGTNFVAGTVVSLRGINSTVAAAVTDIETINGIASSDIEAIN